MATELRIRRGTTAENDAFTGAEGELTFDTETKTLRTHDGATAGGFEAPSTEKILDALATSDAGSDFESILGAVGRGAIVEIVDETSSGYWIREDGWAFEWMRVIVDLNTTDGQSFATVLPFSVNRRFAWWATRFAPGFVSDSGNGREAMASAIVLTGTGSIILRVTNAVGDPGKEVDLYVQGYLE